MSNLNLRNKEINKALTIKLDVIPDKIPEFQEHIRRAPKRESKLTNADIKLALKNALRYIPDVQRHYQDISFAQQARGIDMSKKE